MYKSFRVKNFRCFKDLQINDLGRVNLIAGKNNTGKTALMEAIYILAGNREPRTIWRRSFPSRRRPMWRESDEAPRSTSTLSTIFLNFSTDATIEISADNESESRKESSEKLNSLLKISSVQDFGNVTDKLLAELIDRRYVELDQDSEVLKFESAAGVPPLFILLMKGNLEFSRFSPNSLYPSTFLQARQSVDASQTESRFDRMQNAKEVPQLVNWLNIIESRLEDLRLGKSERSSVIEADIGLPRLVSINDLGDGMKRLTDIFLAMHEVPHGLLFIDEIENGIHHTVQKDVWKAIGQLTRERELDIQVFATTHSLEMIRAAYEAFKDDDPYEFRYHRLDRKPDGDIEAVTYNDFIIESAMSTNWEVRG